MTRNLFTLSLLGATFAVGVAVADEAADSKFLTDAIQGNLAEVGLGKLAQSQAASADVKAFGARMVSDHTKAGKEAKALAKGLKVAVPTAPSDDQKATYEKLAALKGTEFDKAFVAAMEDGHVKTIDLFKEEAALRDGKVSAYAAKTLPTLEHHKAMVDALAAEDK